MITPSSYFLSFPPSSFEKFDDPPTAKIFGKSYQELVDRLEYKSKMMSISYSFFRIAAATHVGGGASFLIKNDEASLYILFYSAVVSIAFLYTPYLFSHRFGLNAEDFLEGGKLLENFLGNYKIFKLEPEDAKITQLFLDFERMGEMSKWLAVSKNNKLLNKKDFEFFHSFGKFILMTEASNILSKKCKNSVVVKQWQKELKSPLSTLIWKSIGVKGMEFESYDSLQKKQASLNPFGLRQKVRLLFTKALEIGLEQHII